MVTYLQSLGIIPAAGIDYVIGGHQHCDHIGGLAEVINAGYDVHLAIYYNGSTYSTSCSTSWRNAALTTTAGAIQTMPLGTVVDLGSGAMIICVARRHPSCDFPHGGDPSPSPRGSSVPERPSRSLGISTEP